MTFLLLVGAAALGGAVYLFGWLFALLCFGFVVGGLAANELQTSDVLDAPPGWSSAGGRVILGLCALGTLLPIVAGFVSLAWWSGIVGCLLAFVAVPFLKATLPAPFRLILGFLTGLVALVWWSAA